MASEVLYQKSKASAATWMDESGGFGTGWVFRRNREEFQNLALDVRLMRTSRADEPSTATTVLGQQLATPIMVAPMSRVLNTICGDDTFAQMARGAKMIGAGASLGHPCTVPEVEMMVKEGAPTFRTIKPLRDRDAFVQAMREAEEAGCFAVAMDIDAMAGLSGSGDEPGFSGMTGPLTIDEIRELREQTKLPFVLKGILSVSDAEAAVEIGADAIIVSNHGAHFLDYALPSIKALPKIADAVGSEIEVWFDSGVRRGSDILKALALGADVVLIGRVAIWGLALGGAEGMAHVLDMLTAELRRNMLLTGVDDLSEVPREIVVQM
jgi:isopentenyl diphosphate isomerase/L-lactate dehydrogenase-like FMN-dependent dehydrogenase